MDARRSLPNELERQILATLGQDDLTRAALVCRRFRDMSVSLLFRHVASWSVHFDDKGYAVYSPLHNSYKAIFCILDDVTLGRHVRFLDVRFPWSVFTAAEPGQSGPLTVDDLHTLWSSMPGLVALSIAGSVPVGRDLGLHNVDFPRLQRLRLDEPNLCIEFLQRHLHRLHHISVVGVTKIPLDWDMTVATLAHYEGPYLLLAQLLHAGAPTHSLESCALLGDVGQGIPPRLAPLARYQNLRYLSICLNGVDRATLLEMIRDCPPFTGVTSLKIDFQPEDNWDIMANSADPPWCQLMRPFPLARYIILFVDLHVKVVRERGTTWAKEISETCTDAMVIVLSHFGFKRAGPGFDWVADDDAEEAIDVSLNPPVVHPVCR